MARFDVYENRNGSGYLLDVQTDLLSGLNTRVVVPLIPQSEAPLPAKDLNPTFEVEGIVVVMATQYLAAVPSAELKKSVLNLGDFYQDISNALDMLFVGF